MAMGSIKVLIRTSKWPSVRREFLLKAVNVSQCKGLEIGPLNKPLVKKEDIHGAEKSF